MDIVVCIKQVPEITEVKIDPETRTLIRNGVPSIVNPFDEIAVEEAVRIKERVGATVTVVTMGPPQARDALLKCLAMGADKAVLITDRAFAGADTWATAYTLSQVIKKMSYDVVFCGKQAIDGDTAQVGPELAELLGIPHITYVRKVELHQDLKKVIIHRETDEGYDVVECKLPVLLTAIKGLNEPRLPSLMNILAANRKEIKTITVADIGGDPEQYGLAGSLTQVVEVFTPEPRGKGIKVDGSNPEDAAKQLVQFLFEKNLL